MTEAGLALIEEAKRDGSWTRLDAVEDLVVPDDLAAALASRPGARENWDGFPRSVRRAALLSIVEAKRPETRAKRVAETARLTARGERPAVAPGQRRRRSAPRTCSSAGPDPAAAVAWAVAAPSRTGLLPVNSHTSNRSSSRWPEMRSARRMNCGMVPWLPARRVVQAWRMRKKSRSPISCRRDVEGHGPRKYTAMSNRSWGPGRR